MCENAFWLRAKTKENLKQEWKIKVVWKLGGIVVLIQ